MEGPASTPGESSFQKEPHSGTRPATHAQLHTQMPPTYTCVLFWKGVHAKRPPQAEGAGRLKKRRQVLVTRNGFF